LANKKPPKHTLQPPFLKKIEVLSGFYGQIIEIDKVFDDRKNLGFIAKIPYFCF